MASSRNKTYSFGLIMAIYLLGLFVGGLYVGMVAPVRTVIQAQFGLDNAEGIWVITIYALFYASFIPIIGNLADRKGQKRIFLACMAVFCVGAGLCGLSPQLSFAPFPMLLVGRVLQAIGACGIIPLANAEVGTSAPPDKRGFALGITAAASGISNVLGAGVGSGIIGLVGQQNWPVLFYVCIPIGIATLAAGIFVLPKSQTRESAKVDVLGSITLIALVFCLLLGIQLAPSLPAVGLFVVAVLMCGVFALSERRAHSPIIPLCYFKSSRILITLGISFFVGGMINSMTLIPEFAEVALSQPTGSGGIYMVVIGVFSMVGPPVGGKLIDKYGAKPVLLVGLTVACAGYLFLGFVACNWTSLWTILIGLAIMGMGLGFCMGAPVNYMILENVPDDESNIAISAVTLVRQVGLSVAPAIFVAFITSGIGAAGYMPLFMCAVVCTVCGLVLTALYKKRQ